METKRKYYFEKNENWYFFDINDFKIKLKPEAPEKAKQSYEGYLKDKEYDDNYMNGLISEEEYDEYNEIRSKELEEENSEFTNDEEKNIVKNLFGV